jgi:lactate dehydrogenase-like 2-hydroxyacid dehydrogenase
MVLKRKPMPMVLNLEEKKARIVGIGRIGQATAKWLWFRYESSTADSFIPK